MPRKANGGYVSTAYFMTGQLTPQSSVKTDRRKRSFRLNTFAFKQRVDASPNFIYASRREVQSDQHKKLEPRATPRFGEPRSIWPYVLIGQMNPL